MKLHLLTQPIRLPCLILALPLFIDIKTTQLCISRMTIIFKPNGFNVIQPVGSLLGLCWVGCV